MVNFPTSVTTFQVQPELSNCSESFQLQKKLSNFARFFPTLLGSLQLRSILSNSILSNGRFGLISNLESRDPRTAESVRILKKGNKDPRTAESVQFFLKEKAGIHGPSIPSDFLHGFESIRWSVGPFIPFLNIGPYRRSVNPCKILEKFVPIRPSMGTCFPFFKFGLNRRSVGPCFPFFEFRLIRRSAGPCFPSLKFGLIRRSVNPFIPL